MKQLTAILLIVALTSQSLSRLNILINFKLNQEYIAAELCENKQKPELQCHGACYLTKKLVQEEEQQQKAPVQERQEQQLVQIFLSPFAIGAPAPAMMAVADHRMHKHVFNYPEPVFSIFHPPRA